MQVLSEYEEKSIAQWCERLDEWGHPSRLAMVKSMAEAMVARQEKSHSLGKHWITYSPEQPHCHSEPQHPTRRSGPELPPQHSDGQSDDEEDDNAELSTGKVP